MTNKTLYKNLILDYLRKNGKSSLYDIWQSSDKAIGEVLFEEIVQSLVDDGLIEKVGETAIPTVVEDENGQLLYAPDILNDPTFFEVYKYKAKDNQNDEDGDLLLSHSREAFLQANSYPEEKDNEEVKGNEKRTPQPRSISLHFLGHNVPHCFNVDKMAQSFISILDSVSSPEADNVSMLGIFGSWGRGKSYFFKVVKESLIARNQTMKKKRKYDVVEFIAWKYQSVPAIWASLFETIIQKKSKLFRLWFSIKRNCWPVLKDLLVCSVIPLIINYLIEIAPLSSIAEGKHVTLWVTVFSALYFILNTISKHYDSMLSLFKRVFKKTSFVEQLGVQAEIENALAFLMKMWVNKKRINDNKVILYIEDVDRCEGDKMISIIESLRTILEQPEIRKRLIVVISIDNLFLWNALERKYNESSDKVNYIIKNAFDKLFISSITLPEIDYDGEVEFLAKIEHGNMSIASNSSIAIESTDANNNQLKKSANIDRDNKRSKERMTEDNNAVVRNILSLIKAFLDKNRHIHLTPRQINCVFYRTLLANNLLVSLKGGDSIDTSLVEHIILLTCKDKHYISGTIDDILKMVIPYPASYIISQSRPMGF